MAVYGYRTAKYVNYGAIIRWPDDCTSCHDFRTSSRKLALAMAWKLANENNGKVVSFQSQDEMSLYDQGAWGFIEYGPQPSNNRIDYDLARD